MKITNNFEGASQITSSTIKESNEKERINKIENKSSGNNKVKNSDVIEISGNNKQLNELNSKLKSLQETISMKQAYLKSLNIAKSKLLENKNIESLYVELIKAAQKLKFNNKSLLKNIIPGNKEFYKSAANITKLRNNIENEIKKTISDINLNKKNISKVMISMENIKASFSKEDIGKLKSLFNNNKLFGNMNKDSIISLIK